MAVAVRFALSLDSTVGVRAGVDVSIRSTARRSIDVAVAVGVKVLAVAVGAVVLVAVEVAARTSTGAAFERLTCRPVEPSR